MKKLFSFGTENGQYGVATQNEIDDICRVDDTTAINQELAKYDDVEWSVQCGCNLKEGLYNCLEGIISASEEGIELMNFKLYV